MPMDGLRIAENYSLPIDYVTSTGGILAKKGAGKSNAAVKTAEEMHKAGVPWVAVDPKGDWWGIRSSADGNGPGLPIVVFGGRHGDIPLEPTAGAFIADLVLTERLTCVLDVSEFSRADTRRFLLAFGERLYRQADAEPLHLFLEEAHEYLPQMVRADDAPLVGAWQRIVKQGRFKGLGVTLISQRSASVNKDVLTQVDTLIMMRTTSPQDRAAVKAWIDVHGDSDEVLSTLPSLAAGEAWVWAPEWDTLTKIQFLRRSTFDSGATPKVGEKRRAPATLADIDLGRIKEQMAETIEKAKADDPKALRAKIVQLEKALQQANRDLVAERETKPAEIVHVEVPIIDAELVERVERSAAALVGFAHEALTRIQQQPQRLPAVAKQGMGKQVRVTPGETPERPASAGTTNDGAREPAPHKADSSTAGAGSTTVTGPMRKLLTVLALYGPRTKRQLAMQAGYSMKGGGFNNPLSALRSQGLVERGDPIVITTAGIEALGEYDPLPQGDALLEHWMGQLPGPARKILQALVDAYPTPYSKEDLAHATGYAPVGGGFNNPLSRLRSLELVTRGPDITLTEDFAGAINA